MATDGNRRALHLLVGAIESHGVAISKEDARRAFEDYNVQELATWVQENLNPGTLLSKEEEALYSKLEHQGIAHQFSATPESTSVQPLEEDGILHALSALEASTSAIEKQDSMLKAQRDALFSFQKVRRENELKSKRAVTQYHRKWQHSLQSLSLAYGELLEQVKNDIDEMTSVALNAEASLSRGMAEIARQDDKRLSSVQVALEAPIESFGDGTPSDRELKLCAALAGSSIDSIRYRLDRIYLESVSIMQDNDATIPDSNDELAVSLDAGLDSLYEEIVSVVNMSVDNEYAAPLAAAATERCVRLEAVTINMLHKASTSAAQMLTTAEGFETKLRSCHSHIGALAYISDQIANMISQGGDGPIRLQKSIAARDDTLDFAVEADTHSDVLSEGLYRGAGCSATRRLLSVFGIPSSHNSDHDQVRQVLSVNITEQERRSEQRSWEVQSSLLSMLLSSTRSVSNAEQSLVDALMVDTSFGGNKMSNAELESRRKALQEEIKDIGSKLAVVNMEKLRDPNEKLENFVAKWGVS